MSIFGKTTKELDEYKSKYWNEQEKNLHLRRKLDELEEINNELKKELEMIKPVFKTPGFKPAMTERCEYCKFAYFSEYNGDELLGCAKDVVCEDFVDASRRE